MGWQQNEYVESWLNNAERNESRPAHKSGSRAPTDRSTALITSAPSLPTHPPRPGPRRAISGDLALSRAISGPRRAISGDLGASLARRHTCSKKGRARLEPRGSRARSGRRLTLRHFSGRWRGPVRRRPARRVHRPPRRPLRAPLILALLGLLSRSCRGTRRDSLPPTSDGLGRCCAPLARVCISRVPACQG